MDTEWKKCETAHQVIPPTYWDSLAALEGVEVQIWGFLITMDKGMMISRLGIRWTL